MSRKVFLIVFTQFSFEVNLRESDKYKTQDFTRWNDTDRPQRYCIKLVSRANDKNLKNFDDLNLNSILEK